ncbi:MAG TPA: acyloxyacyl hydrolase [Flavobacterium sp.]|nr:acyloxyacyl hydrolase [Flavobacterium sp.]
MKKLMWLWLFICPTILFAQQNWRIESQYYTGSILPHSDQITHLITDKPSGFLVSASTTAFKNSFWKKHYNYPDIGFSFHYQNNHNQTLGDLYGLFAHYDFYFFNRRLNLRIAQGVAFASNPFDRETNFRNLAYGSHWMPSTYFQLMYRQNIWKNWQAFGGLFLIHHSNATIKTPNISTNTVALTAGLSYTFEKSNNETLFENIPEIYSKIRYSLAFRSGINESHIVGMGQKPFYHFTFATYKRLGYTGSIQLGTELFLSNTVKETIAFIVNSFPESDLPADTDWKRIGVFAGYEMHLNRLSLEGNVGIYVYDKYKENGALYQRLGLRYYVTKNWFGSMSLKTHFAKAEAFELGIGYKL